MTVSNGIENDLADIGFFRMKEKEIWQILIKITYNMLNSQRNMFFNKTIILFYAVYKYKMQKMM